MTKSVGDVFSEYTEAAIRQKHRYETTLSRDARLVEVREQKQVLGAQQLEDILAGRTPDSAAMERLEQQEQAVLAGIGARRYACETCRDTGRVPGGYCTCLLDRIYMECYGAVDVDALPGFDMFDPGVFDNETVLPLGKTQRGLIELYQKRVWKYVQTFPETEYQNILLTGKAGLGKSFLMGCVARAARERRIDVLYIRANALYNVFFAHRMGEQVDLGFLQRAQLLLIDDVGTEPVTQNVSKEYFYDLVDVRLLQGRHTVFATNIDNLQARYDDRIASRMQSRQHCMVFYFDGRDLRSEAGLV